MYCHHIQLVHKDLVHMNTSHHSLSRIFKRLNNDKKILNLLSLHSLYFTCKNITGECSALDINDLRVQSFNNQIYRVLFITTIPCSSSTIPRVAPSENTTTFS